MRTSSGIFWLRLRGQFHRRDRLLRERSGAHHPTKVDREVAREFRSLFPERRESPCRRPDPRMSYKARRIDESNLAAVQPFSWEQTSTRPVQASIAVGASIRPAAADDQV